MILIKAQGRFLVHDHMNTNICVIHLVPGFSDEVLYVAGFNSG